VNELFMGLSDYALVSTKKLIEGDVQPSFIFVLIRQTEQEKTNDLIKTFDTLYSIPKKRKINEAFCSNNIIQNHRDLFYLGPTIAPAPSNLDVLESAQEAINFYREKGVTDLTFQVKEMGSRAYVLWFRSDYQAQMYGFDTKLVINSRSGFTFFDDEKLMEQLWHELWCIVPDKFDCVMLDCEVTPWSVKGEGLIQTLFNRPLYAEKLHLEFFNDTDEKQLKNVNDAISALHKFDKKDEKMKIHIFDVLYMDGPVKLPISQALSYFDFPTEHFNIIPTSANLSDILALVGNKEGIVVKPTNRTVDILPAMKVRNPDFLRLIYGAHYFDYFELLTNRPLNRKRKQSYRQYAAAEKMIHSFHNHSRFELLLHVIEFLSEEEEIDATL